jgi:glycosidase
MTKMVRITLAFLLLICLAACSLPGPAAATSLSSASPGPVLTATATILPTTATAEPTALPTATSTPSAGNLDWWKEAVFYEIFVRSFFDSNGDGIGDFNGLTKKLDYLNDGDPATTGDLGVTALWLMPIHPSPSTHGYDVTDYYAVNPQYGSLEDFRRLVAEAHRRGMRVIIDMVLNHTSSQHPWFIQSQDPASPYRNWYVWADRDPGFKGPWNQQVWYPLDGGYYYAYFWEGMPDLNYTNPAVTSEMQKVARFWLADVGIDGFRLDAIGSLIENGAETVETAATHDWLRGYYAFVKSLRSDAMTVGEVWREDPVVIPYLQENAVDLAFEFDLSAAMLASINEGNSAKLLDALRSGTLQFPVGRYGTFLTNHDMARVMTQLGGDDQKAKAAASLYFALPGVPFIYYGEEIGLSGEAPDEMGRRPMQWSGGQYAGFSTAAPWKASDSDPVHNVAAQSADPNSLFTHYRAWIAQRLSHPALRTGELSLLSASDPGVFACLRTSADEAILVLVNLTGAPLRGLRLSLNSSPLEAGDYKAASLWDGAELATVTVAAGGKIADYTPLAEIPPYTTLLIGLQS